MSDLLERLRDMAAGKSDDLDIAAEAIEEIIDLNWRVVLIEEERDALRAQIAAHEKVCAGTWVKVAERLPDLHWSGAIISPDGEGRGGIDLDWYEDYHELPKMAGVCGPCAPHFYSFGDRTTHWLDARMPGEER